VEKNKHSFQATTEQQLQLYSFYKQATVGPCNVEKPGFFDFVGKAKWSAWKDLGNLSADTAKARYVEIISSLVPGWNQAEPVDKDGLSTRSRKTGWVSVSLPVVETEEVKPEDQDLSYWAGLGDEEKVLEAIKELADIDKVDAQGQTPLHWACDNGYAKVVEILLDNGASINSKDNDGMTPLHYACMCEHANVVELLLKRGADPSIIDDDGFSPVQATENKEIRQLLGSTTS